eukprot:TRINITY_DN39787_c0_g1_i1.p1 TRINITY_DN39787_c0_g1~~TRINITY_DN39787_c0_g1_i1.p1  ORF type:complete len:367 (-),score=69.66 TRINITY_DN39787_c0_g1_i1:423-1523(-)
MATDVETGEMQTGSLVTDNGSFGFIRLDSGGPDMFVMPAACVGFAGLIPRIGTRLRFNVVIDDKTSRPRAENVESIDGSLQEGSPGQPVVAQPQSAMSAAAAANAGFRLWSGNGGCLPGPATTTLGCGGAANYSSGGCGCSSGGTECGGGCVGYGGYGGCGGGCGGCGGGGYGGCGGFGCGGYGGGCSSGHGGGWGGGSCGGYLAGCDGSSYGKAIGCAKGKTKGVSGDRGLPYAGGSGCGPSPSLHSPISAGCSNGWSPSSASGARCSVLPALKPTGEAQDKAAQRALEPGGDGMVTGVMEKVNGSFGFIKQDGGGPDMFVMPAACTACGGSLPPVGTRLLYAVVIDSKTGRPRADAVSPIPSAS